MQTTAKFASVGVVFLLLEDETGNSNIVVWKAVLDNYRAELLQGQLVRIKGGSSSEKAKLFMLWPVKSQTLVRNWRRWRLGNLILKKLFRRETFVERIIRKDAFGNPAQGTYVSQANTMVFFG